MQILPLFPLELVVFPGEELKLHIFEPRYKELIRECEESSSTFGIPAYIEGKVSAVGTEMRLLAVERRYADGEMDIRTRGMERFTLLEFFNPVEGKLYAGAAVRRFEPEPSGQKGFPNPQLRAAILELFAALDIEKDLPGATAPLRAFDYGHLTGLTLEQEYELLQIKGEKPRQEYLLDHLDNILPIVREMKRLQELVQQNGHFRNIVPPRF